MSDEVDQVPPAPETGVPGPDSDTSKILAVLGYLTGVAALVAILMEPYKDEKWLRLHAVQALGLYVLGVAVQTGMFIVAAILPFIGASIVWLAGVAVFVLALLGMIKAWQGEYYQMPVVYDLVKQFV